MNLQCNVIQKKEFKNSVSKSNASEEQWPTILESVVKLSVAKDLSCCPKDIKILIQKARKEFIHLSQCIQTFSCFGCYISLTCLLRQANLSPAINRTIYSNLISFIVMKWANYSTFSHKPHNIWPSERWLSIVDNEHRKNFLLFTSNTDNNWNTLLHPQQAA